MGQQQQCFTVGPIITIPGGPYLTPFRKLVARCNRPFGHSSGPHRCTAWAGVTVKWYGASDAEITYINWSKEKDHGSKPVQTL